MCHFIFCGLLLCAYVKTILSSNSSILHEAYNKAVLPTLAPHEKRDASDDAGNFLNNNNNYYERLNAAVLNNESTLTDYPNLGHSDYRILKNIFRFNGIEDLYKSVYYMLELKMSVDAIRYFSEKEIVEAICDSSLTSDVLNEENRKLLPIVFKIADDYIRRTRISRKRQHLRSLVNSNVATFIENTLQSQIVCTRKAFQTKTINTLSHFFKLATKESFIKLFNEAKNNISYSIILSQDAAKFANRDRFAKLCGSAENLLDVVFQIKGDISTVSFLKENVIQYFCCKNNSDTNLGFDFSDYPNLGHSDYRILKNIFQAYSAVTLYKCAYYLLELEANETAKRYFCNFDFLKAICDTSETVYAVEQLNDVLLSVLFEVAKRYISRKGHYGMLKELEHLINFNVNIFVQQFLKLNSELMHVAFNGIRIYRPSDFRILATAIDLPNIEKQCKFIYYASRLNLSAFRNNPELLRDLTIKICGTDEFLKNKEILNKRFISKLLIITRNIIVTYFGVERYNEIKNEVDKSISDYKKCTLLGDDNEAESSNNLFDEVLKIKLYIDANLFSKDKGKHTQKKNDEVLLEKIINDAIYFPNINNDLSSNSGSDFSNYVVPAPYDAIYFSDINNDLNSNSGFDFSNYVVPAPYNEAESSNTSAFMEPPSKKSQYDQTGEAYNK